MATEIVLIIACVLVVHSVHSSIPPKFIKASYGVQKALYAKNFGYSLVPIPTFIQRQAYPPKALPLVGHAPVAVARKGRGYKYYRPRSPPRRRKRPSVTRRRPPSSYGVPIYATKYKNYTPYRRPPSKYKRYKKRRPYRLPPRRPLPYVNVHHDIDDYEQEIHDYDEYNDNNDNGEYYVDIPSKRLPLQYDKDFLNRHADLYNRGYNPGSLRGRPDDSYGDYSLHRVRSRIRYQTSKEDAQEQQEKDSLETLWPGEVTSINTKENSWLDQIGGQSQNHHWQDSPEVSPQRTSWQDMNPSNSWMQEVRTPSPPNYHDQGNNQEHPQEWQNHPRTPSVDNQWNAYQPEKDQWSLRPTSIPDLRSWTTSLRPKLSSAAVAVPSRPVVPREQTNPIYNWDSDSQSYQSVVHETRPRYQAHYSEEDFSVDRKSSGNHRSQRASGEQDIGFGEGMEVVDDGVAGWKVKK